MGLDWTMSDGSGLSVVRENKDLITQHPSLPVTASIVFHPLLLHSHENISKNYWSYNEDIHQDTESIGD